MEILIGLYLHVMYNIGIIFNAFVCDLFLSERYNNKHLTNVVTCYLVCDTHVTEHLTKEETIVDYNFSKIP